MNLASCCRWSANSNANLYGKRGFAWSARRAPTAVYLSFLDWSRYSFLKLGPKLSSRGLVDSDLDPLLHRKSGSARNRTRDLWICCKILWPLDHRNSHYKVRKLLMTVCVMYFNVLQNMHRNRCKFPNTILAKEKLTKYCSSVHLCKLYSDQYYQCYFSLFPIIWNREVSGAPKHARNLAPNNWHRCDATCLTAITTCVCNIDRDTDIGHC
jgi:hypothetical protein